MACALTFSLPADEISLMHQQADLSMDARPTNVRYTVLAWACSLSMLTYIDRVCIKNVGGDMQTDLGISEQDFGWVFSAFGLVPPHAIPACNASARPRGSLPR